MRNKKRRLFREKVLQKSFVKRILNSSECRVGLAKGAETDPFEGKIKKKKQNKTKKEG